MFNSRFLFLFFTIMICIKIHMISTMERGAMLLHLYTGSFFNGISAILTTRSNYNVVSSVECRPMLLHLNSSSLIRIFSNIMWSKIDMIGSMESLSMSLLLDHRFLFRRISTILTSRGNHNMICSMEGRAVLLHLNSSPLIRVLSNIVWS
jgi:hypothetical protein